MGNAVATKIAPWTSKKDTLSALPVNQPRPSRAPLRRLSFYAGKKITEESLGTLGADDPIAQLDWHAFLDWHGPVHHEL